MLHFLYYLNSLIKNYKTLHNTAQWLVLKNIIYVLYDRYCIHRKNAYKKLQIKQEK